MKAKRQPAAEDVYLRRVRFWLRNSGAPQKRRRHKDASCFSPVQGDTRWVVYVTDKGRPVGWQKRRRVEHCWLGVLAANGDKTAAGLMRTHAQRNVAKELLPFWHDVVLPPYGLMNEGYDFN
jgi:hypothetical protein